MVLPRLALSLVLAGGTTPNWTGSRLKWRLSLCGQYRCQSPGCAPQGKSRAATCTRCRAKTQRAPAITLLALGWSAPALHFELPFLGVSYRARGSGLGDWTHGRSRTKYAVFSVTNLVQRLARSYVSCYISTPAQQRELAVGRASLCIHYYSQH